jgi:hypothetical protein
MASDTMQRVSMAREKNQSETRVFAARKLIYGKNVKVNGAAVERLLQEMSLVPTVVRCVHSPLLINNDHMPKSLECLLRQAFPFCF